MTGRRFRFRFQLRFMLICVACMSLLFALFVHFDSAGRKRISAVKSIEKMGATAFPTNSIIEFQQLTFPGTSANPQTIMLPIVRVNQPGRIIFGLCLTW